MAIFVGLDLHRAQITYDALDADTGEVRTGRIRPANRGTVAAFLARTRGADQEVIVAVEAMTGWRFVAEECARAGVEVHLAEPAETRERQDRKRRAKTGQARRPSVGRAADAEAAARVVDRADAHP
jgi:transposase